MQTHSASAIFKCAVDTETRDIVRNNNGLEPLASLLSRSDNPDLMWSVTGAIWKCSTDHADNVKTFGDLKVVEQLVSLLSTQVRLWWSKCVAVVCRAWCCLSSIDPFIH